ncbi:hypothetical protein RND71_031284 [Anisodus tanguticus]|uniref:Uncharacterized protein n=1 Tax=Anisodus tanguticus TaxID=243964 RepID=A0AAE1RC25_9SOLA|nr:hypothetical protein RND71_031284 [Anisodus tanguticus]
MTNITDDQTHLTIENNNGPIALGNSPNQQVTTPADENPEEALQIMRSSSGLVVMQLMNEPQTQYVPIDTLIKYYQAGYEAVRKYTSSAYVILSNRLGNAENTQLLSFARGLSRSVIN